MAMNTTMELLAAVRLICAKLPCLNTLPMAAHMIDAFLLNGASEWTLESASERGFLPLLDRLLERELPQFNQKCREYRLRRAILNGYSAPVLKWWLESYMPGQTMFSSTDVCEIAMGHWQLHIVQWLVQERRDDLHPECFGACKSPDIAYWLYEHDRHLPVVVYVDSGDDDLDYIKWCMAIEVDDDCAFTFVWHDIMTAISYGPVEILSKIVDSEPVYDALDIALRLGRLDVAKWLHQNYSNLHVIDIACRFHPRNSRQWCPSCTWKQVDLQIVRWAFCEFDWKDDEEAQTLYAKRLARTAAATGNLDVLRFLFEISLNLELEPDCVDEAASNGHVSVVCWLHENNQLCTFKAMDGAAENGHLEIVQWLHENRTEGCTTEAMDKAAANGYLDVVQWLHAFRSEGSSTDAMDYSAKYGHLNVVRWLHENRQEGCTSQAMDFAATYGHLQVVEFLHENRNEGCTTRAMDYAANEGHVEVVKWLHESRAEGCTTSAMDLAAQYGHLDVLNFLHQNRNEGCSIYAQVRAMENGRLDIFKWFHDNRVERCPSSMFLERHYQMPYYFDIVAFAARQNYLPLGFAVDVFINAGLFGAAEELFLEAQLKGVKTIESSYIDSSSSALS